MTDTGAKDPSSWGAPGAQFLVLPVTVTLPAEPQEDSRALSS